MSKMVRTAPVAKVAGFDVVEVLSAAPRTWRDFPMEKKLYGLRLPGEDYLLGVYSENDGETYRLVAGYGTDFLLPASKMLDYLTDPPTCHANAWQVGGSVPHGGPGLV